MVKPKKPTFCGFLILASKTKVRKMIGMRAVGMKPSTLGPVQARSLSP